MTEFLPPPVQKSGLETSLSKKSILSCRRGTSKIPPEIVQLLLDSLQLKK